eukprot:Gb_25746 [translate_table: standard]
MEKLVEQSNRDPREWARQICLAGRVNNAHLAVRAFKLMELQQIKPNATVFNSLIYAYGFSNNLSRALSLFEVMERTEDCHPTLVTYNTIISIYSHLGDAQKLQLWYDACKRAGFSPNTDTFKYLIVGFIRANRYDKMDQSFKEMISSGVTPSVITLEAAMEAFCKQGLLDRVKETLKFMMEEGWTVTEFIAKNMFEMYCKVGRVQEMEEILGITKLLNNPKFVSDVHSKIIKAYALSGHLDDVEFSVGRMLEEGRQFTCPGDVEAVIRSYFRQEAYERLELFLNRIKGVYTLTPANYDLLLTEYAKVGQYKKLQSHMQDMKEADADDSMRLELVFRVLLLGCKAGVNVILTNSVSCRLQLENCGKEENHCCRTFVKGHKDTHQEPQFSTQSSSLMIVFHKLRLQQHGHNSREQCCLMTTLQQHVVGTAARGTAISLKSVARLVKEASIRQELVKCPPIVASDGKMVVYLVKVKRRKKLNLRQCCTEKVPSEMDMRLAMEEALIEKIATGHEVLGTLLRIAFILPTMDEAQTLLSFMLKEEMQSQLSTFAATSHMSCLLQAPIITLWKGEYESGWCSPCLARRGGGGHCHRRTPSSFMILLLVWAHRCTCKPQFGVIREIQIIAAFVDPLVVAMLAAVAARDIRCFDRCVVRDRQTDFQFLLRAWTLPCLSRPLFTVDPSESLTLLLNQSLVNGIHEFADNRLSGAFTTTQNINLFPDPFDKTIKSEAMESSVLPWVFVCISGLIAAGFYSLVCIAGAAEQKGKKAVDVGRGSLSREQVTVNLGGVICGVLRLKG